MRIGLDPNRWNRPPRKKTWFDWYFGCLLKFFFLGIIFVLISLAIW